MSNQQNLKTILIVEDDELLAELLQRKLQQAGFATQIATTTRRASTILKKEHIDLVVLDIILPGQNGLTFLKEMRLTSWGEQLPVVVLTNIDDTTLIMEALEFGEIEKKTLQELPPISKNVQRGILKYVETRVKNGVSDFLIKSQWDIDEIVSLIEKKCAQVYS